MPVIPPPAVAAAAAVAQYVVAPHRRPSTIRSVAAGAIAALAAGTAASAMATFRRHGTTVDPLHPQRATSFVQNGPFRFTRNPMYVGLATLLTAHAMWRGDWRALLPVAGFIGVMDRTQIPAEEAALEQLFGAEYAAYRARVPRWLGPTRTC